MLRSEATKALTHPVCLGGMALMIALRLGLALGRLAATSLPDWEIGMARGALMGQLGAVIFAAGLIGQEFDGRCLRTSCIAVPSRGLLLAAKLLISSLVVCTLNGVWWLAALALHSVFGGFELAPGELGRSLTLMAGSMLTWVLLAGVGAGASLISSSLVLPIAIMAPLMLGVSQMLYLLTDWARFLPDLAGYQLLSTEAFPVLLAPMTGALVQALWCVGVLAIGTGWLLRRDIR